MRIHGGLGPFDQSENRIGALQVRPGEPASFMGESPPRGGIFGFLGGDEPQDGSSERTLRWDVNQPIEAFLALLESRRDLKEPTRTGRAFPESDSFRNQSNQKWASFMDLRHFQNFNNPITSWKDMVFLEDDSAFAPACAVVCFFWFSVKATCALRPSPRGFEHARYPKWCTA